LTVLHKFGQEREKIRETRRVTDDPIREHKGGGKRIGGVSKSGR